MKRVWLILWSWLWFSALSAQQVWYVTPAGGGAQDGSSWGDAFSFIQDALDQAQTGDSVWVAAGIYKPTTGTDPGVYLELPSGVVFMGGFAGWESSPEQRDVASNTTIISGQLSPGQKSYLLMRVLNPKPGTRIDGVVFEDTYQPAYPALPPGEDPPYGCITYPGSPVSCIGGGLWVDVNDSLSVTQIIISNSTFRFHNQEYGAGVFLKSYGNLTVFVMNCYFNHNGLASSINSGTSGMLFAGRFERVEVWGSIFEHNFSSVGSGISRRMLTSDDFPFESNKCKFVRVTDSKFTDNFAITTSAGAFLTLIDTVSIEQCHFEQNHAGEILNVSALGGALTVSASTVLTMNESRFVGNSSSGVAGAMVWSMGGSVKLSQITNCVFSENSAMNNSQGGAIFMLGSSDATIANCTFWNNFSEDIGGAVAAFIGGKLKAYNCIFYQNSSTVHSLNPDFESNLFGEDSLTIAETIPLNASVFWNSNVFNADPLFLDAPNGDFRLSCHSPAVDAGDLSSVLDLGLQFDIDGLPRIQNGLPDIGAHEWQSLAADLEQQDVSCHEYSDGMIQVQVNDGTPPYEYGWNTGATTPIISELTAGEYTLTVTDSEGCESIYQLEIMEPDPLWLQLQVGADSSGTNTGWLWVDSISGGTAPYVLLWSTGSTELYLEGLPGGTYGLSLLDAQGCTLDTVLQVNVILSTSFQRVTYPLNIFPNPTTGAFTLSLPTAAPEDMQVRITDMYGRKVALQNQSQIRTGTRQHTLDISHLPAGVYWVSVHCNGSEVYGGKLVVQ